MKCVKLYAVFCPVPKVACSNWKALMRKLAGVRDYTKHAHRRAHAEAIAADGGTSPTSPSKDAAGGLTLGRTLRQANS